MIAPRPCACMMRPTAWVHKKVPFRLVSNAASQSASVISRMEATGSTPALLTRMST